MELTNIVESLGHAMEAHPLVSAVATNGVIFGALGLYRLLNPTPDPGSAKFYDRKYDDREADLKAYIKNASRSWLAEAIGVRYGGDEHSFAGSTLHYKTWRKVPNIPTTKCKEGFRFPALMQMEVEAEYDELLDQASNRSERSLGNINTTCKHAAYVAQRYGLPVEPLKEVMQAINYRKLAEMKLRQCASSEIAVTTSEIVGTLLDMEDLARGHGFSLQSSPLYTSAVSFQKKLDEAHNKAH